MPNVDLKIVKTVLSNCHVINKSIKIFSIYQLSIIDILLKLGLNQT